MREGWAMGNISVLITRKFLPSWKEFPLGGFLGVLCVLAVNADTQFNRQVAKYAKKTPSKAIWLRLGCSVKLALILSGCQLLLPAATERAAKKEKVREQVAVIDTNLGRIVFRFFEQESPKTVRA